MLCVCLYVSLCVYISVYVYMFVCMCVFVNVCVCVCIFRWFYYLTMFSTFFLLLKFFILYI